MGESYIRVWHDNSGKGKNASWYLKFIIVHDLHTREEKYFICEKWLALDEGDGLIDRILPVCGEKQKQDFRYLLKKETKQKITDQHLWFSIFIKPAYSNFIRIDRLTCCFVVLLNAMLMNILYYGVVADAKASGADGLTIGPITLTIEQVYKNRIIIDKYPFAILNCKLELFLT